MYQVVHTPPVLPSQWPGAGLPTRFDAVLACALAKQPAQRFASAADFKAALVAALSSPATAADAVADPDQTRVVPAVRQAPVAPPPVVGLTSLGSLPAHWDASVLAQAEQALARHLGPLATVLVRRTARECQDPAELMTRLAAHVEDPAARQAFLGQAAPLATAAGRSEATAVAARTAPAAQGADELDAAWLDAATRLLAERVGPIAKVLVKRAATRTRQRAAFCALLGEALDDPVARQALLQALARLP
jgi:serine/threonine-protein kinase